RMATVKDVCSPVWLVLAAPMSCGTLLGFDDFRDGCPEIAEGKDCPASSSNVATAGTGGTATSSGAAGSMQACTPNAVVPCYSGPPMTEMIGTCHAGSKTCSADGSGFTSCAGEQLPAEETCASKDDENCNGLDCVEWAKSFGDPVNNQQITAVAIDPSD